MKTDIAYLLFSQIWSDLESHKCEFRYSVYVVYSNMERYRES